MDPDQIINAPIQLIVPKKQFKPVSYVSKEKIHEAFIDLQMSVFANGEELPKFLTNYDKE